MKNFILKSCVVLGASIGLATTANAMNTQPINAASVDRGTGCLVAGDPGNFPVGYALDPTCRFQIVTKLNKDGSLKFQRYMDHGQLQPGQTPPDRPIRIQYVLGGCDITEKVNPSGKYSAISLCKP